jgi:peptide/nickel transport system permease protein
MISERLVSTVIMMLAVSIVAFILIQLPPADTNANRGGEGYRLAHERPLYVQYFDWIGGVLQGDFGYTWVYHRPVSEVIGERLGLTLPD